MNVAFLRSGRFWIPFLTSGLLLSAFFTWELDLIPMFPGPIRMETTQSDIVFTIILILLLSTDAGLYMWQKRFGSCPRGTKRATGIAGALGVIALLCPVCLLLPVSLIGVGLSLAFLAPFIPLIRLVALVVLIGSTVLLWPKR